MKKTKIVCTISDINCDVDFLKDLYDRGMNVVRMNTAHANDEGIHNLIANVRKVSKMIPILIDTKGDIYPCAPIHKPCLLGHLGDDIEDIKRKGRNFYLSYPIDERKLCKGFMV